MNLQEIKREYGEKISTLKKEYKEKKAVLLEQKDKALKDAAMQSGKPLPIDPPKRPLLEEIGNAVTHGVGALFAPIALVLMLLKSDSLMDYLGASVYFFGLFVMFLMSCLYHSFKHGSTVKRIFRRFDYSSIYLLIGATFAPILLSHVGGILGNVYFALQWAVIITGIVLVAVFGPTRFRPLHMTLYFVVGWSGLMLIPQMLRDGFGLLGFILLGGAVYSLGMIPFALKRGPSHFIWHFFVLLGAVVQWLGIYLYIYC
jgi:hemolysin III